MVRSTLPAPLKENAAFHLRAHILFIEARFYEDIADLLVEGAALACGQHGITYERIGVAGALEIPQAFAAAVAARKAGILKFDGVVALGCVIRGETAHYDVVCNNTNHWLMHVAVQQAVPVGNAILTVDTRAQALARAEGGLRGKGGDGVRACAQLIKIARSF